MREAGLSIDAHSRTDIANVEHRIHHDVLLTGVARAPEFLIAASRNGPRLAILDSARRMRVKPRARPSSSGTSGTSP